MERHICTECKTEFEDDCPATSRKDNTSVVCTPCSHDEAFDDYFKIVIEG